MEATISNNSIALTVNSLGAEITSLKSVKTGLEYIWQGDPQYWTGHAPVLFPIVGSLRNKRAVLPDGKECHMERHGVARRQKFKLLRSGESTLTFRVGSSARTSQMFPCPYELEITYTIRNRSVAVKYTVHNPGYDPLPFCIGGHPAFNCPIGTENDKFSEYVIEFDEAEMAFCMSPDQETGLLNPTDRRCILNNRRTLPLRHSLFEHDALVFDELNSRGVVLYNPVQSYGVRLDFPDFPYLGIWSAGDAPFVALEPWHGMATCLDEDDRFMSKRGVCVLKPGKKKSFKYVITMIEP